MPASSRRHLPALAVCATVYLLALPTQAATPATTSDKAHSLDWIEASQLSDRQRQAALTGCCGAFIDPYQPGSDALTLEQTPISASARKIATEGESLIILEGQVRLAQGPRLIETEYARLDQSSGVVDLNGHVTLREAGLLIRADTARAHTGSQDASVENARFVLHQNHISGSAGQLEKFGERLLKLEQGQFTTCEPDRPFWQMKAKELALYPESQYGTAKGARLEIKDIPVLYLPYIIFPIGDERQSGLLFPSFSKSTRKGLEYSQPIYWNIAPEMDATFTPGYMEKHGTLLEADFRHLSSFLSTEIAAGFLGDDRGGYAPTDEEEEYTSHKGEDRWLLQVNQTGGSQSRLKTEIDYTDLSDVDYLRDITSGDTDQEYASFVRKYGAINYRGDGWSAGASASEVRYLNESVQRPYKELPNIYARTQQNLGPVQVSVDTQYSNFDLINYYPRSSDDLVVGERFYANLGVSATREWQWGYVTPSIGVKTLNYQLEQAPLNNATTSAVAESVYASSPSLASPQASLDLGLFFERFSEALGTRYIQTLEPRLFYLYSGYEDHSSLYSPLNDNNRPLSFDTRNLRMDFNQLFRTSRFNGLDRLDDANQLSIGVTSRFLEAATGQERLAVSLGQILRFETPKVVLNPDAEPDTYRYRQSEYVGRVALQATDRFRLGSDLVYDQHMGRFTNASASAAYEDDGGRLVSLTYRYLHRVQDQSTIDEPDLVYNRSMDQLDIAAFIPLTESWSLMGRANYDFTYNVELDNYAGFEYNDCCYRVRLLWREWLNFDYNRGNQLETVTSEDYDRGFFIDLQLKGLASISDRVGKLLSKSLPGYAERESNLR